MSPPRRSALLLILASLALTPNATPAAADALVLFPAIPPQSIAHGNANKIVIGRFNTLHVVYETQGRVRYSTSADGVAWSAPSDVSPSGTVARHPALAVDGAGKVGVVWVANPGANGVGNLYYSHKVGTTWISTWLNAAGAEPAIIASGIIDLSDFGVLTEIGATWANARSPGGKTAKVSWSGGEVVASTEDTLTLSALREQVDLRGEGFQLSVQELGYLADYDTAQPPEGRP